MKKLLTLLALVILLTGCTTAPKESFLDEKIKCKKMAEEKIKAIEKGFTIDNLLTARYTEIEYSQDLDTCIMSYIKSNKNYDGTYSWSYKYEYAYDAEGDMIMNRYTQK